MAMVYFLLVLLIYVFRGSAPFERAGTTLSQVSLGYLIGGLVGGVVFGLLLPLGKTRAGAALLGFVVAVPVIHVIMLAVDESALYGTSRLVITLLTAVILGPACGVAVWYMDRSY